MEERLAGGAVALVDIDAEAIANTSANLESAGYNARGYAGDILDTSFFAGVPCPRGSSSG